MANDTFKNRQIVEERTIEREWERKIRKRRERKRGREIK